MWIGRILASLRHAGGNERTTTAPLQSHAPQSGAPTNSGLRLLTVDEILESNRELVGRIKLCYGCDPATFTADLLAPIRHYLAYVNQLPATMDSYFTAEGGLAASDWKPPFMRCRRPILKSLPGAPPSRIAGYSSRAGAARPSSRVCATRCIVR